MSIKYYVTNFYAFTPIPNPAAVRDEVLALTARLGLNGLLIVAPEGLNGTLSGIEVDQVLEAKSWLKSRFMLSDTAFKDGQSLKRPFRQAMQVRLRNEIVTLERPELRPHGRGESHLSPKEWQKWLEGQRGEFILLDTRNEYEVGIGTFKGAQDPRIGQFTEFPNAVASLDLDRNKTVLMFCTGGIRCEKASLAMREQGFERVYQLEGGILKYLEEFPDQQFEGECFVFDDRVAVNQRLEASEQYVLCVHCGGPGNLPIQCVQCEASRIICSECSAMPVIKETCSKNCAHHRRIAQERAQSLDAFLRSNKSTTQL